MLREVSIEVLRRCPNHCLHCSSVSGPHCDEILRYSLFRSVVDDAVKLGASTICLSGGEPFLHPDIISMASYICKKGIKCSIYTSGITMDGGYAPISSDILRQLTYKGVKLIFNIEGACENTYNRVMGTKGCFDIMKQSVLNAVRLSIMTEAHFVPTKINVDEIQETISMCEGLGLSRISFLRLVLHGRARHNMAQLELSDAEFRRMQGSLVLLQKNSGIDIRIGVPLSAQSLCHSCEAGSGKLNIKYDGNVFPCEVFKNEQMARAMEPFTADNIAVHSLYSIYHNSLYLKTVRELSQEYACGNGETCIGQYLLEKAKNGGLL